MLPHARVLTLALGILLPPSLVHAVTPVHIWSRGAGALGEDITYDVAFDAAGDVIITGTFLGSVDFGLGPLVSAGNQDVFLAKYDPTGAPIWTKRFGDSYIDRGYAVTVDAADNIIVTGFYYQTIDFGGGPLVSNGGNDDIFVAKLDPSGAHIWSRNFGGSAFQGDTGYDVATDAAGNVFLTGEFAGTANFGGGPLVSAGVYDIYIAKLDANGAHLWSKSFGTAGQERGNGCAVDAAGNVTVAGFFSNSIDFGGGPLTSAGATDIWVAQYDPAGAHLWSKSAGDVGTDQAETVAVDGSGNVVIAGHYRGTVNLGGAPLVNSGSSDDIFVAKYDAGGVHQWSQSFGSAITSDIARAVAIDPSGNIVVGGYFSGTINFGGGNLTAASADVFLASFDAAGAHRYSRNFGSTGFDDGQSVAMDGAGHVAIGGGYAGSITFGGPTLSFGGGVEDAFVADFFEDNPIPVLITQFVALPRGSQVQVSWSLHSDEGLGGYTLYRAAGTSALRAIAEGASAQAGSYLDTHVAPGETYHYQLVVRGADGGEFRSPATTVTVPTGVTTLGQNYPNPFNPRTSIDYVLGARAVAQIIIYDAAGKRVKTIDQGMQAPGTHRVDWDGRDDAGKPVSSGVYFYRLNRTSAAGTKKMILLK